MRAADSGAVKAIKRTKTYRQRSIEIDPELFSYLKGYRQQRALLGPEYIAPTAFIFGTINNELRGPNDVTRRFAKAVRRAQAYFQDEQFIWVTIQRLRHGHATHLLILREHPKVVQERLGHTNIQTTLDIYSHVLPTIQRDAVNVLWSKWQELP